MGLSISRIINLTIEVPQTPPAAPNLTGICIFGKSTKLASYERVKQFSPTTLSKRFSASDPEYKAAQLAFSQHPQLQTIYIARRFLAAQAGTLLGSTMASVATLQAITAGAFDVSLDGTNHHITALDLSGCTGSDMATVGPKVATALQTKLNAALSGTTCTYTAEGFLLVTSPTATTGVVDYAATVDADTTTAAALGLSLAAGARRTAGFAAESSIVGSSPAETQIQDSLDAARRFSAGWFGCTLARDASLVDQQNAADWGLTNQRPVSLTTQSAAAYATPTSGDTDIAGYIKRKNNGYAFATYSTDTPDAGVAPLARIAVVNYELSKSVITLWGKTLAGVSGENIDDDVADGLLAKNCNVMVGYDANPAIYTPGTMGDGTWIDQVFGLTWLRLESLRQLYATLTSGNRVFQTDDDVHKLVLAWEVALQKGVNNGLLAPGLWPTDAQGVGNVNPGDRLELGYYVYAAPVSSQSEADRMTRVSPPITALAKGSGAIQGMNIKLVFSP